jgi:PAS domain S-box-containing protein
MTNLFERFFSISQELFIVTDGRGEIEYVNPKWKDVLGYDPREVAGRQIYDYFHPKDVDRSREARAVIREKGEYRDLENRCLHKDGSVVWIKWNLTRDPETGRFYGVGTDVSSTAENTRLLRERSIILSQFVETSKDGFGYCDPEFKAIYLNRFLTEELGWSLGPQCIFDFVSPATRDRYKSEMIPSVIRRNETWEGEVEFVNLKTGEPVPIWQRTFCSLAMDGTPLYIAFFATDLRTKRRAEAAVFHSAKMASLGQMAAGLAHEVNNPITIIHGTAGLLKKAIQAEDRNPEKMTRGLERIEKTALRISRIVKGLRMFSRSGENDPAVPTALSEILEETLDLCRERFRDYAIDLRIDEIPAASVRCRPTQISQVLLNLLNNSFDAVSREDERWVRIDFAITDDRVRISVTDSGPGLSEDTKARLMEPFFTTKEPGQGTGLGLSISRGIVEEHGGKLVHIPEAPNTCFTIDLPRSPESHPVEPEL